MKTAIELTQTARRKVDAEGLGDRVAGLVLGEWAQTGDFVELAGDGGVLVFIIHARRIRIEADGRQTLVFKLDHPARPVTR
ncbi:hypothetical protein RZ532_00010 [Nitratireductor aquimarinus]|uniref:hypothetical protein n=1 Tax=Nitratireductor aquimarinus TaxID=889300 RepID=UPI002935BD57|nr:hypothetical protein [Nitratireductor aquimarinus]MDV2964343.1 hypothetical protein [Nitratireductor aquimarinus]